MVWDIIHQNFKFDLYVVKIKKFISKNNNQQNLPPKNVRSPLKKIFVKNQVFAGHS